MARTQIGGRNRKKAPQGVAKMRIRRGDRVRVIRGNDAGKDGTVLRVIPEENKVVVEGINRRVKHARPTQDMPEGGRITFDAPIHASNVMLIDPVSGEPSRVRMRGDTKQTRERIAVRSGNPIPKTTK